MAASRGKHVFEVITIVVIIVDIFVGWLNVHQMYGEIKEHQGWNGGSFDSSTSSSVGVVDDTKTNGNGNGNSNGNSGNNGNSGKSNSNAGGNDNNNGKGNVQIEDPETCLQPDVYWTFIFVFEAIGTLFALIEIYYICKEMRKDKQLQKEGFRRAFVLVALIYVLSVFPATILEILYRKDCVCAGMYVMEDQKHWRREAQHARRDLRRNIRDLSKGLLGGISVILLQCLLFVPEVYAMFRKLCDVCGSISTCCKMADTEEDGDSNNNNSGNDDGNKGRTLFFLVSLGLSMTFVGLFTAEIIYVFCIPLF